jgi:hypothetical protein
MCALTHCQLDMLLFECKMGYAQVNQGNDRYLVFLKTGGNNVGASFLVSEEDQLV